MAFTDYLKQYGPALEDFGKVATGIAAGRAAGRTTQADFNLRSGIAQNNANLETPDVNARRRAAALADSLRGRLLQGTQDASVSGLPYGVNMPTVTGGQRPSNITGAADLGKTIAAKGDALYNAPDVTPGNFSNLAPGPNALDKILGAAGEGTSILSTLSKFAPLAKLGAGAASAIPGLGATTAGMTSIAPGASFTLPGAAAGGTGSTLAGLATNPFTIAGAALGIGLAIKKHQNATAGDRNAFAKDAGFSDLASFNNYLSTLGPAGQAARNYGENVVGKHNKEQNQQWMSMVQQAISQSGSAPLPTNQQVATPFGMKGRA